MSDGLSFGVHVTRRPRGVPEICKALTAGSPARLRLTRCLPAATFLMAFGRRAASVSLLFAALLLVGALGDLRVDFAVPALEQGAPIVGRVMGAEGTADDYRIAILLSSDRGLWWDSA